MNPDSPNALYSPHEADLERLRQEADTAALAPELVSRLKQRFATQDHLHVVDLAGATGGHLRTLAPLLPNRQHWTLASKDRSQLMLSVGELAAWADTACMNDGQVILEKGKQNIHIQLAHKDFTAAQVFWDDPPDLFTLRAGLDTAADPVIAWLSRIAAKTQAVLYVPFLPPRSFSWNEPHMEDEAVLKAYNLWCLGNAKRLGLAGSQITVLLKKHFEARGYDVLEAASMWHLKGEQLALNTENIQRIMRRVRDGDSVPDLILSDWGAARAGAREAWITHHDILAIPA
jgi:hypothetical protein